MRPRKNDIFNSHLFALTAGHGVFYSSCTIAIYTLKVKESPLPKLVEESYTLYQYLTIKSKLLLQMWTHTIIYNVFACCSISIFFHWN